MHDDAPFFRKKEANMKHPRSRHENAGFACHEREQRRPLRDASKG
jgi:hypothetical protein